MAPPGGLPDRIPPRVVETIPASDSVGVGLDSSIQFRFSERMDHRSVERSIFISPRFERDPKLKWGSRALEIRPVEPLRADRTYLITLGAESSDESRNRMGVSFHLAFSTGTRMDQGEVLGTVEPGLDEGRGQIFVWMYDLAGMGNPDPGIEPPAYVTEAGTSGEFRFPRLGAGTYRIFAFRDGDRDQAYTSGEALAVAPANVPLPSGSIRTRLGPLQLSVRDTTGPRLISVRTTDRRHIQLRFDEPVHLSGQPEVTAGAKPHPVLSAIVDPEDSTRVWLSTAPQAGGVEYLIDVSSVQDRHGNPASQEQPVSTKGDVEEDRKPPKVVFSVPSFGLRLVSGSSAVVLVFSESMNPTRLESLWVETDSTQSPAGKFSWVAPNRLRFDAEESWEAGATYDLIGGEAGLQDEAGNGLKGGIAVRFSVASRQDLGELEGRVAPRERALILEARSSVEPGRLFRTTVPSGDTSYVIADLPSGSYRISGFLDRDGDGSWHPGQVDPFLPAEPRAESADTLEVRPRWRTTSKRTLYFEGLRTLSSDGEN